MISWDSWATKAREVEAHLESDKRRVVAEQLEFFSTPKGIKALTLGRSFFSAVPEEADDLINTYILGGVDHPIYDRTKILEQTEDYIVLYNELLPNYIGKYYTETVAAKEFLDSTLEIKSAVLVKYLTDKTRYTPPITSEYVIEHIYSGEMHVLYVNTPDYMRLGMYRPLLAHGYQPKIDPPIDVLVHKGLHVLVFTYGKVVNNVG